MAETDLTPPRTEVRASGILREDRGGLVFLRLNHPASSANILDQAFMAELEAHLDSLHGNMAVKGLVILSEKPNVFLAGADLQELKSANEKALEKFLIQGQRVFQKLADLGIPTGAAIHGAALGGGLELALACDWRVASPDSRTKLGLPETNLGILPAWGGSTRLARLIGVSAALDIIVGGKSVNAFRARKIGLIDEVVPRESMADYLPALFASQRKRKPLWLVNNPLAVSVARFRARRVLRQKTRGLHPAKERALEVVCNGVRGGIDLSLERERDAFLDLVPRPQAKQLLRVFLLGERAKKQRPAPDVRRAAVVGAGVMGSGIAQCLAVRGVSVTLTDLDETRVGAGVRRFDGLVHDAVNKRVFTERQGRIARDLLRPVAGAFPLSDIQLVIEAAVEEMGVKKRIFADLAARADPGTILATNTSALSVTGLADGLPGPERIVGLHFFNPPHRMPLVEVVITSQTAPEVVDTMLKFVCALGKTPVLAKDSPGFIVNRILMPYLIEAGRMFEAGADATVIDDAMLDFGMPMGPLRLLDEIGLDVAAHVSETMRAALGDRFACPDALRALVAKGQLGRKTGSGFYHYGASRVLPNPEAEALRRVKPGALNPAPVLAALMSEEAKLVLEEGVAVCADDIDMAMVYGAGYAPFRGGPLTHASDPQPIQA